MRLVARRVVFAEIAAMTLLLGSYIWLWQDSFPGDFAVCVVLYFAVGIASHVRHGEPAREIGLRLDNVGRSAREAILVVGPLIVLPVLVGVWLESLRFPELYTWPLGLLRRFLWGTAQQYGLLAFFYRRFVDLFPGAGWRPICAAAGIFSLFHLPNPFLTLVTFVAGIVACWLYRRQPNLYVLGMVHALLSLTVSRSLPLDVTFGMRVGPGFLRFLERLPEGIFG